jgi:GNAT superfamily N-acetyltransferase
VSIHIRRLGPGDEAVLAALAQDNALFDVDGRSESETPLAPEQAAEYLANPAVLHWVAFARGDTPVGDTPVGDTPVGDTPVGDLFCLVVPLSSGIGREVLLYEMGVHTAWRRQGVGRALMNQLDAWMREHGVPDVWVLADNDDAAAFYHACGFAPDPDAAETETGQPLYLVRTLD